MVTDTPLDILVLGGGPAGCVSAIGLARLGYSVTLVQQPRSFAAVEGISKRTLHGLKSAGCAHALDTIPAPSIKLAYWGGLDNAMNQEHLIDRLAFDAALLRDAQAHGVQLIQGRVQQTRWSEDHWHIRYTDLEQNAFGLAARFLVEARGRSGLGRIQRSGPNTLSLLQRWQLKSASPPGSMALSNPDGWFWGARFGKQLYTQLTLSVAQQTVPKRHQLPAFLLDKIRRIDALHDWLAEATPISSPCARASTPLLSADPVCKRLLRVGDAALTIDPLSGSGIFQALSLALCAPAVINTLLKSPDRTALAECFYREKVTEMFLRNARLGRDFYRLEENWAQQPFWAERRDWPDQAPCHPTPAADQVEIREKGVLVGDQIVPREVLLTPEHPLGIWQVSGIELAPIARVLNQHRLEDRPQRLRELLDGRPDIQPFQDAAVHHWLQQTRILPI